MNGGVIGKTYARQTSGVFLIDDVLERPELRYKPFWNPTTASGLACGEGAVATSANAIYGTKGITWTKTTTSKAHSLIYGSMGIGTVSIRDKRLCAVIYLTSTLAGEATGYFALFLGSGLTTCFSKSWTLSSLQEGWHHLQFNAADMTVDQGSPNLDNITYIKAIIAGVENAFTFAAGSIVLDALLWK